MTVRALDSDGDIITSGKHFISGIDEVAQTVKTRLHLFYGEYFRDITQGTPWKEIILGKGFPLATKEAALRKVISETPGVIALMSFSTDFDLDSRTYTVTATILTPYGETYLEAASNG